MTERTYTDTVSYIGCASQHTPIQRHSVRQLSFTRLAPMFSVDAYLSFFVHGTYTTAWGNRESQLDAPAGYSRGRATQTLCEIAVASADSAIQFVPRQHITRKICVSALENKALLSQIPDEFLDAGLCYIGITRCCENISRVPDRFWHDDMYGIAIRCDAFAITHCPESIQSNAQYWKIAICSNPFIIQCLPDKFATEQFYDMAIAINGYVFEFLPDRLVNYERALVAVRSEGCALKYVSKLDRLDQRLCDIAVECSADSIPYVPDRFFTSALCSTVFSHAFVAAYMPRRFLTDAFVNEMVNKNPMVVLHMPQDLVTDSLLRKVVALDPKIADLLRCASQLDHENN